MFRNFLVFLLVLTSGLALAQAQVAFWPFPIGQEPLVASPLTGQPRLNAPWAGGFNMPQVHEVSITSPTSKELIVYDRFGQGKQIWSWQNNDWVYQPAGALLLPPIKDWFRIGDLDADGNPDLLTQSAVVQTGITAYKGNRDPGGKLVWSLWQDTLRYTLNNGMSREILHNPADLPAFDDFDNDGDADLMLVQLTGTTLVLLRNETSGGQVKFSLISQCAGQIAGSAVCGQYSTAVCRESSGQIALPARPLHLGTTLYYQDFDADGNRDIIIGDIGCADAYYFKNRGTTMSPLFLTTDATVRPQQFTDPLNKPTFPGVFEVDVDQDGLKDVLLASNENSNIGSGIDLKRSLSVFKRSATGSYGLTTDRFLQDRQVDLGSYAAPAFADFDQDGDQDMVVGYSGDFVQSSRGGLWLFRNVGSAAQPNFEVVDTNWLGLESLGLRYIKPTFGDLNLDGAIDLAFTGMPVGGNAGQIVILFNQSQPNAPFQFSLSNRQTIANARILADSPAIGDVNGDGKPDLGIGMFDGTLLVLQNTGPAGQAFVYIRRTNVGDLNPTGQRSGLRINISDLDRDGNPDLLCYDSQGRLYYYADIPSWQTGTATIPRDMLFKALATNPAVNFPMQDDVIPAIADLDGDGYHDLILGLASGGMQIFKNVSRVVSLGSNMTSHTNLEIVSENPITGSEVHLRGGYRSISIFDINGKKLISKDLTDYETVVSLPTLSQGVYYIKDEKGTSIRLVLLQ